MLKLSQLHRPTYLVLQEGWIPISVGTLVSFLSGIIVKISYLKAPLACTYFGPLINGIGSNFISVYGSRMSSYVQLNNFWDKHYDNKMTKSILFITLPLQVLFLLAGIIINFLWGKILISLQFCIFYLSVAYLQIWVLIKVARSLGKLANQLQLDLDNQILPITTTGADFLGTSLILLLSSYLLPHEAR